MSIKYAFYAYILLSNYSPNLIASDPQYVTLQPLKKIETDLQISGFEKLNRRSGLTNKLNKEKLTAEEVQAKANWAVEYLYGDRFGTDTPTQEQRQTMELDKKKLVAILLLGTENITVN